MPPIPCFVSAKAEKVVDLLMQGKIDKGHWWDIYSADDPLNQIQTNCLYEGRITNDIKKILSKLTFSVVGTLYFEKLRYRNTKQELDEIQYSLRAVVVRACMSGLEIL